GSRIQVLPGKLHGRHIDAGLQPRADATPRRHLLRCRAEDPLANAADQAAVFGEGNEHAGANRPFVRVFPAEQAFHFLDAPGLQPDDGLVDQVKLVFFQRHGQIAPSSRRKMARACIEGWKCATWYLPRSLAAYMARSAFCMSSLRDPASCG